MKVNGDLDIVGDISVGGEAKNLKVEHVSSLPTFISNDESHLVYNQTDKQVYFNNGVEYKNIALLIKDNYLEIQSIDTNGGTLISTLYDNLAPTRMIGLTSDSLTLTITFNVSSKTLNTTPVITCNGVTATLSIESYIVDSGYVWYGTLTLILLETDTSITFEHSEGNMFTYSYEYVVPPTITACNISGYPIGQSEVKEDDTVIVNITADKPIANIFSFGGQGNKAFSYNTPVALNSISVSFVIDNKGNIPTTYPLSFKVVATDGSISVLTLTSDFGTVDGTHTLLLNNTKPSIVLNNINYPLNQTSIGNGQNASVDHTITNASNVVYFSNSGELTISNTTTYESLKNVTYNSGNYNNIISNFRITATRTENNSVTILNSLVNINNDLPSFVLSMNELYLRSGGNFGSSAQEYVMTITTNQNNIVSITCDPSSGTFVEPAWNKISDYVWTRTISIHDNDAKGSHSLLNFIGTNSSGQQQSTLTNNVYEISGFVSRIITIPALSRETNIGTYVTDNVRLLCTNLLTGLAGSNNLMFVNDLVDASDKFTITGPSGMLNNNGNIFYNNDIASVNNNYSGNLEIEIEET